MGRVLNTFWRVFLLVPMVVAAAAQAEDLSLSLDRNSYAPGQEIVVTASCPGPTTSAWVGLYKKDARSQSYLTYLYLSSDPDCRLVFDGQDDPGDYEARLFPDSGYDDQVRIAFQVGEQSAEAAAEAVTATAGGTAAAGESEGSESQSDESLVTESGIVFDKKTYQAGDKIRLSTDCAAYEPDSWIGIFKPDDGVGDYGTYRADWVYFRDQADCNFEFAPRSFAGDYEVRIVPPHGDFIAVRQLFQVAEGGAASAIRLGKADYSTWESIEVTAPCSPEADADSDWIAIFPAGESSYNYGKQGEDWFYMGEGTQSGSDCTFVFTERTETGAYELRQFHGSDYTAYGQLGFDIATTGVQPEPEVAEETAPGVQMPLQISLAKESYAAGEPITVTVQCHQKSYPAPDPWIGLRKISEPLHSHPQRSEAAAFQQDWYYLKNYTQPGGNCGYEFAGRLEPGQYEVRVFRTLEDCACTDNLAGRLSFTVGAEANETAAAAVASDVVLTEAASRHKQYDYVQAHSSDCIVVAKEGKSFENACDFPVSVYFTQKLGYEDKAMQFVEAMPAKGSTDFTFEEKGTLSWLACHESQALCGRALNCIKEMDATGEAVLGYLTATCSAFEK